MIDELEYRTGLDLYIKSRVYCGKILLAFTIEAFTMRSCI